ncbi:trypsin-like peptidase domain-containing protein [Bradyrhizobium sp. UFLA03-84]|uniref:S1C family serine protease n=1 Tax=Bradyrhizobium sp. UFLA03-84 TaxID=418599 RepID=UPI001FD9174F|nr:trypsin-like peptidase domain-containing protein [Bradyrhizobium sp. UFLA03-84]
MNAKRPCSRLALKWSAPLSLPVIAITWMLLLWPGQVQAGEIREVQTLAPLVGKVIQSVVGITARTETAAVTGPEPSNGPPPATKDVYGAGVIIKAEAGLIVTSRHVVSGAKALSVRLSDGRQLDAKFVVADERYDLAMLRISAPGLTAARIGRSIDAEPGDFVLAIGGSSGSGPSVSFGIVSALHRSWPGISCQDLIQTDALLDRGSSGGALFNLRGEVIGIVAAGADATEAGRAFGLAIPSDAIDRLYIRMN